MLDFHSTRGSERFLTRTFGPSKTKIVRVVHMNIFYKTDLEMRDSRIESWTKTEHKWEVGQLKTLSLSLSLVRGPTSRGSFQEQNDFQKYVGVFRSHPSSISIYKNMIFNKIMPKSGKIYKIWYTNA